MKWCMSIGLICIASSSAYAQVDNFVYTLHDSVGWYIDSIEKTKYDLFPSISDAAFQYGELHQINEEIKFIYHQRNSNTMDTLICSKTEIENYEWFIQQAIKEEERRSWKKKDPMYKRIHMGLATYGKYSILKSSLENSLYDQDFRQIHEASKPQDEEYFSGKALARIYNYFLMNVEVNVSNKWQVGAELTYFDLDIQAGKITDAYKNHRLRIYEQWKGYYGAVKVNYLMAQLRRKRRLIDCNAGFGLSINKVSAIVYGNGYSYSHYFNKWSGEWVVNSYGALSEFQYNKYIVGIVPSIRTDVYLTQWSSIYFAVSLPMDLGFKIPEQHVEYKYLVDYTLPPQTIHYAGLRANMGIAFHVGKVKPKSAKK